jgi:beta-fructofuranosidase
VVLALNDKWIWDFWLFREGDTWHAYFLQADKSLDDPQLRHRNVTQGHAVSRDLVAWTHLGTCFGPARVPAWDDWTTWTGSVVRDEYGLWHLFYTGTSHEGAGMHQRIGHATSRDGHGWERVGDGLCLDLSGGLYEDYTPGRWHDRAMRDPWVIRDPDGPGWLMFFTARVLGMAEPNAGGAIGFATSLDLERWTLEPPVYAGGMFGQMEVPQVFAHGGRWYMMFCTAAGHWSEAYKRFNPQSPVTGTHYLMAPGPRGPWAVAPGPFFDGAEPARRYAGKLIDTGGALVTMGFIHTTPEQAFVGAVSDPIPVSVDAEGLLHAHPERLGPGARIQGRSRPSDSGA